MPSLADNLFLFVLALLLFGPKKLPQLAREVGKWVGEFRRASNDFRMQMEDELRLSEQQEKQQQIDKLVAQNPAADPALIPEPEHPHHDSFATPVDELPAAGLTSEPAATVNDTPVVRTVADDAPTSIAESGGLTMRPPTTGLPVGRTSSAPPPETSGTVSELLDALPEAEPAGTEAVSHG